MPKPIFNTGIAKPKYRSPLRKWFGKRYFIAKRYWKWYFGTTKFATNRAQKPLPETIIQHQSFLLRQLKDVDMYLQYNKITNLSLAIECINEVVVQPNEVFSFWYFIFELLLKSWPNRKITRSTSSSFNI